MVNKTKVIALSKDDITRLQATTAHHDNRDIRIQATSLLHLHQTQDMSDTADQFFVDTDTLQSWVQAWQVNGLEGLADNDIRGVPDTHYSDLAYKHHLVQVLENYPYTYDIDADEWSVELLMDYMAQTTHRDLGITDFIAVMRDVGWLVNPIRRIPKDSLGRDARNTVLRNHPRVKSSAKTHGTNTQT